MDLGFSQTPGVCWRPGGSSEMPLRGINRAGVRIAAGGARARVDANLVASPEAPRRIRFDRGGRRDHISLRDRDRAGEHVFELDLVAGPTVLDESPERARIEADGLPAHAHTEPGQPIRRPAREGLRPELPGEAGALRDCRADRQAVDRVVRWPRAHRPSWRPTPSAKHRAAPRDRRVIAARRALGRGTIAPVRTVPQA